LYKTNKEIDRLNKRELGYKEFRKGIDEYDIQQQSTSTIKEVTASGYSSEKSSIGNPSDFNATVTCPGNILSDISRLEVLIGGKRAGNNSPEVINEAADICRRLFAGGIMDIDVYRELIAELAENHGYHSD
jgi:hypothetical protein